MTQFEVAIRNTQKVIDAISNNKVTSQTEIAALTGMSQTLVSQTIRRTEEISKKEYYVSSCSDANEIKWIVKVRECLKLIDKDKSLLFWQYKYLAEIFKVNESQVGVIMSYARDQIMQESKK